MTSYRSYKWNKMYLLLLSLSLLSFNGTQAQTGKILTSLSSADNRAIIQLKWYSSQNLFYREGYSVYRRFGKKENWQPICHTQYSPDKAKFIIQKDSSLKVFAEMIKELPNPAIFDFTLLHILVKTFQSNTLASYLGIYCLDTLSIPTGQVQYKVTYIQYGREKLLATTKFINLENEGAMEPPKNFQVKLHNNVAGLNWNPNDDHFYAVNIFRKANNEPDYLKVNKHPVMAGQQSDSIGQSGKPGFFYQDDSLKENNTYSYQLEGVGYFGQVTGRSVPISVKVTDQTPPSPPRQLSSSLNDHKIQLNWQKVDAPDLAGYAVYQSLRSMGPFIPIHQGLLAANSNQYMIKGHEGKSYYFQVAAIDEAGNESRSGKVFVKIPDLTPPATPQGLILQSDSGKIHLQWEYGQEKDLLGYYVYRSVLDQTEGVFNLLNAEPINASSFTDRLAAPSKNVFQYYVVALDSCFNKSAPSVVLKGKLPDFSPPIVPQLRGLYPDQDQAGLLLQWMPCYAPDLLGYRIFRKTIKQQNWIEITPQLVPSGQHQYLDRYLLTGEIYQYKLLVQDSAGNQSGYSNILTGLLAADVQSDSVHLEQVIYHPDQQSVELTWNDQLEDQRLGYVIYRSLNPGGRLKPISGLLEGSFYQDQQLPQQKQVFYELRAYRKNGGMVKSEIFQVNIK
ncbi:MAG: fibronectin type III domain-containing protein [Candidatus Cyclobacteriaceae bacterium M3_2C_046]